ncbi:CACTA en-spm transposon protein [Cucumis melo var. makuwa]|uniref:CACTA en-spm transposon protein n=1 Tax=Cucumis melo var. makuwa TaxID=1194695 RepID=A0A5A7V3V6_CUCMM|nr:CACTA en-spm transposon protein [Cucumis melo var. makuwa]TYK26698.1 CACTA en-spm transposon protein [Cucumis melo var. makuwa]
MGPSLDVQCYNRCIFDGVRFHTLERDSQCTTKNNGVMVSGESNASGNGNNNSYSVPDEVLHIQYPIGRIVWLFKYGCTMSSFRSSFKDTNQIFLEFGEDLNTVEGSSLQKLLNHLQFLGDVAVSTIRVGEHFSVLDFNDHAINKFVEHQILTCFKEFKGYCHRHLKKYNDPEQTRANPSHILV